jgi:acetolactate decarboxylase
MDKMNKKSFFIIFSIILCILLSGCTESSDKLSRGQKSGENSISGSHGIGTDSLYQVSTIDALLQGVYDGALSFKELKTHGDFGIGTIDGLDGEMLALVGNYYQIKTDGVAYPVSDNMTTPFATVTYFKADEGYRLEKPMNLTALEQYLDRDLPSENFFYAIQVNGNFSYLKVRSVPKQEKPYRKLADVVSNQTVFEFKNVSGTLVGFKTPEYVSGINVPGYHLHFIALNRSIGGHVLELELGNGTALIDTKTAFYMELPTSGNFARVELGQDLKSELKTVEK